MSESTGAIISERPGDFIGIRSEGNTVPHHRHIELSPATISKAL
jgi:hypothetical protein